MILGINTLKEPPATISVLNHTLNQLIFKPTQITHDVSRFKISVHMMQDSPSRRQILQNQLLLFYMNQNLTSRMFFRNNAITENK
jgi:hypothetical protein